MKASANCHKKKYRAAIPLSVLVILCAVFALHLSFFTPSIIQNDSFDFLHAAERWVSTGAYHPAHWPDYPGWVFSLAAALSVKAALGGASDALSIMMAGKFLATAFAAVSAALLFLIARLLFRSYVFSLLLVAVFAVHPVVWMWSATPMSDIPALAFVLASLYFFLLFYKERSTAFFIFSLFTLSLAVLFRLQSVFFIAPYLVGLYFYVSTENALSYKERAVAFLRHAPLLTLPVLAVLAAYGLPGDLLDKRPVRIPSVENTLLAAKLFFSRDISWLWPFLAAIGFGFGFKGKETRPYAFILASGAALLAAYFATRYTKTGADVERYLVPAIPLVLLGVGFLWNTKFFGRSFVTPALISACAVLYIGLSVAGLSVPDRSALSNPPSMEKFMLFPYLHAASAQGSYQSAVDRMSYEHALANAVPSASIVLHDSREWSVPSFFFDANARPGRTLIAVPPDGDSLDWYDETVFGSHKFVFIHRSLATGTVDVFLGERGFRKGIKTNGTVFLKNTNDL